MNNKLIVIIGPTASKKTTLAHKIAQSINGSIINGDVFQMYKDINCGVNKPNLNQLNEINYYLINHLDLNAKYSIYDYQKDFDNAYKNIVSNHKIPILCGGSHLYIDSIIKGYDISNTNTQTWYEKLKDWNTQELHDYLLKYDPESAHKTFNNYHRQLRAVAYLKANNNQPKSILEKLNNQSKYEVLVIMTTKDREELYQVINERFDIMIADGQWVNEVKQLIDKYGLEVNNFQGFKAIGYLQIYNHLVKNEELNLNLIKQKTRHLAKHQLTWCNNKFENKIIFDFEKDNFDLLLKKINHFLYD